MLAVPTVQAASTCNGWPAWDRFKTQFVSNDGRVIDPASPRRHTTSEGQAYALFFALVANDRPAFDRLLRWTEDNLAAGDLGARLPAWQWGRRDDDTWRVIDANAASDADLWMAYALGEAGRLWGQRRYLALASLLADRIAREEVVVLPGLGPTLLPGPVGFGPEQRGDDIHARLNPSYLPLPVLRWLAQRSGSPLWQGVLMSSTHLIRGAAPKGFVGDWVQYLGPTTQDLPGDDAKPRNAGAGIAHIRPAEDPQQRWGSYDAIRVYLWLGLTSPGDPARAPLLQHLKPMADWIETRGRPPEHIDPTDGATSKGDGPVGFSAATLPFLMALDRRAAADRLSADLRQRVPADNAYYEQALALFGQGFQDERYRFNSDGTLQLAWTSCTTPPSPSR